MQTFSNIFTCWRQAIYKYILFVATVKFGLIKHYLIYRCSCGEGYALDADGGSCNDINECLLGTDDCDQLASCTNTAGSWTCKCNNGTIHSLNNYK